MKETTDFKLVKNSLRLARVCLFLIRFLNIITLTIFKDRLKYQAELVAKIVIKIKKV